MSRHHLWATSKSLLRILERSSPLPYSQTRITPVVSLHRDKSVHSWGLLFPGIAVLLLHGSEARAEERPVKNEAQERPAPVSNDSTAKWRLYTDQAAKFGAQGELRRAERFLKLALDEAKQGFGLDDPHVAAATQNLAELYRVSRQYDLAGPLYEQALKSLRGTFGELDVRTAAALHNAAGFYLETGNAEKAQECYESALQAKRAVMGPGHPSVCDSLLPLARLLRRKGRSSEALAMLQQQLRFLEDAGLGTSKGALMLLGQQAAFHKGDGHADRARPPLQRCYDIERGVDPQSLTTAGAAEALAGVLQDLGEYDEARRLLEESLSIQTMRRRNAIPADQMLRLVNLEMKVATPDSFLRAHNMAQRCCDSVESLIQKYDAITAGQTGWVGRWFGPKAASQEQIEKTYKAVPGAVHTLALAYMSLSAAQMALRRPEDVEASLQRGVDVTTCALLQRAHFQADSSNSSPSERQHNAQVEDRILDDRQAFLEQLLEDAARAGEEYKKQRAESIRQWQEDLAKVKQLRETIKEFLALSRELSAAK